MRSFEPPASDMIVAFWPSGETSSMSTSSGHVWSKLVNVTLTSLIAPLRPEATQVDG